MRVENAYMIQAICFVFLITSVNIKIAKEGKLIQSTIWKKKDFFPFFFGVKG